MEVRHEKSHHHTDCLLGELRNESVDHFAFSAIFFLKKSRQIKTSEADTVHARPQLKAHISRTTFAADTMLAAKTMISLVDTTMLHLSAQKTKTMLHYCHQAVFSKKKIVRENPKQLVGFVLYLLFRSRPN